MVSQPATIIRVVLLSGDTFDIELTRYSEDQNYLRLNYRDGRITIPLSAVAYIKRLLTGVDKPAKV